MGRISSYLNDWVIGMIKTLRSHQSPNHPIAQSLIALKGHPATGKSSLAYALAKEFGWPLLDKDDIKDHTLTLPDGNQIAYAILWQLVARQLALGLSVIVDSPLSSPVGYATARSLAERHSVRLLVVETYLVEESWRQRLERRSPIESTHKIASWAAMQNLLTTYNGCWQYPIDPAHHLVVNTEQPIPALVETVRQRLDRLSTTVACPIRQEFQT